MADLTAKYQKLATEYAKLKAQVPVLKKAYLDEQTECSSTREQLKEKEQSMRKFQQEVESLSFRNQQLSKRVMVLQDELETLESQKKKHKHKGGETPSPEKLQHSTSVYGEELQSKIEENAKLHSKLQEVSTSYERQIVDLEERIRTSEQDRSQHEDVVSTLRQTSKTQIERLQQEKAMVEVRLQSQENEIKDYRSRAEMAEQKLNTVSQDLSGRLSSANKIISDKLPFIDTRHRDLNGLNLPTHDRKHQLRARELIGQAANLVGELTQGLSNFFTYSEQRSRIYPSDGVTEPLSPTNTKYCKYLHENLAYLRPVDQSLKQFSEDLRDDSLTILETATDLQDFSKNFSLLVAYCNRLLPYQILSLEEESQVSSCTSTLATKNRELLKSLARLSATFNKLDTYITILATQSKQSDGHPQSSHPRFFVLLSTALEHLHESIKEVSKHYNSKVSLEHQLPTATQKLKTTDECVVSSLVSLVTSTGKMSAFMSGNLDFFTEGAGYRTRGSSIGTEPSCEGPRSHPAVTEFRQKTASYLSSLSSRPRPDSVPHRVAVQNRKTLLSSAESKEGLAKQIAVFQDKVGKLEQEKEHYVLELQLLKIKYDNEQQKVKKMEQELEMLRSSSGVGSAMTSVAGSIEDNIDRISLPTSERRTESTGSVSSGPIETVGQLDMRRESGSGDAETREQLIKEHFTQRINDMTLQLQQADSKAVHFHAEVRALHKQLSLAERSKSIAEEELKAASQTMAQLKDELQTTTRSYEGQLSMMSEHLAGMNEKLAQQKDEIDDLRAQQTQSKGVLGKVGKKTKK
ncbi:protein phosphatase 1 regulatory subunit 21-like isoform X2 [Babylonia areolata]|uniref:protein phosphatase 1 regulatory subunit 21-like isoform X2 n=1 Tax=Babylonia areolata TaxID=304850 RepID=UPI003FD55A6D